MHTGTSATNLTYGARGRSLADLALLGHVRVLSCSAHGPQQAPEDGQAAMHTGETADAEEGRATEARAAAQGWALKVLSGPRASTQGMLRVHASILSQCGYKGLLSGQGHDQAVPGGGSHMQQHAWHGTLVTITDLFHSLPVRKRAHNPRAELERLLRSITHLSLIHPSVQWVVEDSRACTEVLRLHRCSTTLARLAQCYGSGRIAALNLSHVTHSTDALLSPPSTGNAMPYAQQALARVAGAGAGPVGVYKVSGYVGTGYHTRELQLLFLNGRYVRAVPELQSVIEKAVGSAGATSTNKQGQRRVTATAPTAGVRVADGAEHHGQEDTDPMSIAPFGVSLAAGAYHDVQGATSASAAQVSSRGRGTKVEKGGKRGEAAARDARQGYLAYILDLRFVAADAAGSAAGPERLRHAPEHVHGPALGLGLGGMDVARDGPNATLVYFNGQNCKAAVVQLLTEAVRVALGLPVHPSSAVDATSAASGSASSLPLWEQAARHSSSMIDTVDNPPAGPVATAIHLQAAEFPLEPYVRPTPEAWPATHGHDHQHGSATESEPQEAGYHNKYVAGTMLAVDNLGQASHARFAGQAVGTEDVTGAQHAHSGQVEAINQGGTHSSHQHGIEECWECTQAAGMHHAKQHYAPDDSLDDLLFVQSPAKLPPPWSIAAGMHQSEGGVVVWPPREDTLGVDEAGSAQYMHHTADVQLDALSAAGVPTSALPWLYTARMGQDEETSAAAAAAIQHRQEQLRILSSSTHAGVNQRMRVPTYGGLALRVAQGKAGLLPPQKKAKTEQLGGSSKPTDDSEQESPRVTSAFFPAAHDEPTATPAPVSGTLGLPATTRAEERALSRLFTRATAPAVDVAVSAPRTIGGGQGTRYTDTFLPAVGLAALKPGLALALKRGAARKHYGSTTDVASIAYSQRMRALQAGGVTQQLSAIRQHSDSISPAGQGLQAHAPAVRLPQALLAQVGKPVTRAHLKYSVEHPSCYVGQLDNKFLLLSVPLTLEARHETSTSGAEQSSLQQLIIVDQHAADERARLETLETALFGTVPVLSLLQVGKVSAPDHNGTSTGQDGLARMSIDVSADGLTINLTPLSPNDRQSDPCSWRVSSQAWHTCTMATPVQVDFTPAERAVLRSAKSLIQSWGFHYRMEEYASASVVASLAAEAVDSTPDRPSSAVSPSTQVEAKTDTSQPRPPPRPTGSSSLSLATMARPGSAFRRVIPQGSSRSGSASLSFSTSFTMKGRPYTAAATCTASASASAVPLFQSQRITSTPRTDKPVQVQPGGGAQQGVQSAAPVLPAPPSVPAAAVASPPTGKVWVTTCPGLWDQTLSIEDLRDFIALLSCHAGGASNTKAHLAALEAASKSTQPDEPPAGYIHRVRAALYSSGCKPPAISRILNSKACRGAVMFGDSLTRETALGILQRVASPCMKLPFQCAHGRPAMIPLLTLAPCPEDSVQ